MSVIIEKEAKTVEQAIDKGLAETGLKREDVEIEIVSLGTPGFLGIFGGKPAKVRLKVMPQPRIKRLVEGVLERMDIPGMVGSFREEGSLLIASIESFEGEKLLKANGGAPLHALEYLVNKIYRDSEYEIRLDIGGFLDRQNDELKTKALQLAAKVKESGQEYKMDPMPSHQRKLVHKALENHPDVKTFAVGSDERRRVIIAPRLPGDKPGRPAQPAKGRPAGPRPERPVRGPRPDKPESRPPAKSQPQRPAPKPQPAREKPSPRPADDFKSRSRSPKGPRPPAAALRNEGVPRSAPSVPVVQDDKPFVPRGRKPRTRK
jgi:spoIIIJ-associated protein